MTTDPDPSAVLQTQPAQTVRASWIKKIPWPLFLFTAILLVLLADRYRYLTHFGFVYTDGDQVAFWYQADDIAHGIFREPCIYGQSYNVPIEAWVAAPLLVLHVPAYIALPLATTILGLVPFFVIALLAYRHGYRWAASIILLIPLALPIEYTVVSSLPRGFINGLVVATPTIACWLFYQSRKAFFFAAFFAVLGLTVNPNCSIILLAAGVFALLTHWRSPRFYIFSLLGALAAVPAPLLIQLFYQYHPQSNAYHPKLPLVFSWPALKYSLFLPDQPAPALNHRELDLFFAHFIPVVEQGWLILVILPALVLLLAAVCRFKAAIAVLIASVFTILCLGIERIHTAYENVFYSGSRMYLALPILFSLAWLWFDMGLQVRAKNKFRFLVPAVRVLFIICLIDFALSRNVALLDPPSPFVTGATLPPVNSVQQLRNDSAAVAAACRKFNVSFVLVCDTSCFDEAAPVFSDHTFETLYPFFERRT
ncbi:MAG TPA: hypothetical protein VKJ65_14295, partial [Phycisphaerae bacterium]|nr:hypothetical protein [Phycisphaerae bacterium]